MPVLSQAAIAAADISAEERSVHVVLHSESYIPQRLLDQTAKEISGLYGLRRMNLMATHPASELQKIEPEELRDLSCTIPWREAPLPGRNGNGKGRA